MRIAFERGGEDVLDNESIEIDIHYTSMLQEVEFLNALRKKSSFPPTACNRYRYCSAFPLGGDSLQLPIIHKKQSIIFARNRLEEAGRKTKQQAFDQAGRPLVTVSLCCLLIARGVEVH